MATFLITGANGQMGQEFRALSLMSDHDFIFTDRSKLDITNRDEVLTFFSNHEVDICINCAAYTAVDKAESDASRAMNVNAKALNYLSEACNDHSALLIHYSTDYVYHSVVDREILETDPCEPKSVYGKSKYAGEQIIQETSDHWIILRVSWLYSQYSGNFVKSMMRLGNAKHELGIVDDQIGTPTYGTTLANHTLSIALQAYSSGLGVNQIYNYSNLGQCSWKEFAESVFNAANISCAVKGISTKEYGAPAPRPNWSLLSKQKIQNTYTDIELIDWKIDLQKCILQLS